jgi:adenylate kinase family enzyme
LQPSHAPIHRINITGASGSGTTTLGRALAATLQWPVFDADDFFWQPTDPPYQLKRSKSDRQSMVLKSLGDCPESILSGSICGWGDDLEQSFDAVVFLTLPKDIRLARLTQREQRRFGRIDPEFLEWASRYDDGGLDVRSRALHEHWLATLTCSIIRLDGQTPVPELVEAVRKRLTDLGGMSP